MSDLLIVEEIQLLVCDEPASLVEDEITTVEILAVAEQGPPGPRGVPGPSGGATLVPVGPMPISGHSAVALSGAGDLIAADCRFPEHLGAVLGIVTDAYSPGDDAVVQLAYAVEHIGWTWAPGPVYVGAGGVLTQALPAGALFCQVVGHALAATRVLVDLQPPIAIAIA